MELWQDVIVFTILEGKTSTRQRGFEQNSSNYIQCLKNLIAYKIIIKTQIGISKEENKFWN
jgi:hypothetical protein